MKCGAFVADDAQAVIWGAHCAVGPNESTKATIEITGGRITRLLSSSSLSCGAKANYAELDLSGFFVMPGLINAHDHLEFALFPRLADPPYRNYVEWGKDIHDKFPEVIAVVRSVPKWVRVWWGGIRNLLSGVTTVCHHNPLWPELLKQEFPVQVVQKYGWGHSLALGGDLRMMRAATPKEYPFIVHACEGVDEQAREELWELDRLGLLDGNTVLVHGLGIDRDGVARLCERGGSLIVCPSSNSNLFHRLPNISLLASIDNLTLGNDSPLTAEGDLLDEIRFAIRCCNITPENAYRMVTKAPAAILRIEDGAGSIGENCVADLIAVRDTGTTAADRMLTLSAKDVEFVMLRGRVQLASDVILERLPLAARQGLEPLSIEGTLRWLRAPVKNLLQKTEDFVGKGGVRMSGRQIRLPARSEIENVC